MVWIALVMFAIGLYAVIMTALWWQQKQRNIIDDKVFTANAIRQIDSTEVDDPILQKADEAQSLQLTFQKFVPRQFVDHFSINGAESLKLGYANEADVALMFCDIRGFTGLAEQMSPQQLMNFLNSYFLRMNAPIHDNFGFIDKFIGDAIMALFDHPDGTAAHKAADAVNAALDLQKALRLYNHHRANSGYKAVDNGIGIHFGAVVLGTVGSDDRMDTTVIGDAVNIAQRIESLTDYFSADILASKVLVDAASEHLEFAFRLIDDVLLKGKTTSIEIVEIYQHLDKDEIKRRNATIPIIKQIIALRTQKQFSQALVVVKEALLVHPGDSVLEHHQVICEGLLYEAVWDGKVSL